MAGRRSGWGVPVAGGLLALAAITACGSSGSDSHNRTPDSNPAAVVRVGEPWVAYQSYDGAVTSLRLVRPDGSGDHDLLPGVTNATHPDWAPDGTHLAYVLDNDVWVVGVDGKSARKVFDCTGACVLGDSPAWSPDGGSIAFVTADGRDGVARHGTVAAVEVSTGHTRTILTTNGPEYPAYPRWSPDGTRLVLSILVFGSTKVDDCRLLGSSIATTSAQTSAPLHRLTSPAMYADYPDWSPDGDWLVFSTFDLGTRDANCLPDASRASDLYLMHPDGTGRRQLTHNPSGSKLIRNGTATGPLSAQPTWLPDGSGIVFTQVSGDTWPGWTIATVDRDGTGLVPATGAEFLRGTHARFRPT